MKEGKAMQRKKTLVGLIVLLGIFVLFGTGTSRALEPTTLEWSCGSVGGGWYTMGAGIAEIVKAAVPEITIKVIPGGGTLNPPRVGEAKALMAWGLPPFVATAMQGMEPYDKKYPDIRCIGGSFSDNNLHWAAAKDTGATSIEELIVNKKPIRITVGTVGTSDEFSLRKVLESYGVTYDDIKKWGGKVFFAGYSEATSLLKDRHVDYAFANIAPPAAYLLDAKIGRPLRLLPFSEKTLAYLEEKYSYTRGVIPQKAYPDMLDQDIVSPVMGTVAIVHKSVPDDVVYAITKAICENKDQLPEIHKSMAIFDPKTAWQNMPAPLHPGAEKYYKEMGYMK
jgi:TRAP transporter TAXI family solute receptor